VYVVVPGVPGAVARLAVHEPLPLMLANRSGKAFAQKVGSGAPPLPEKERAGVPVICTAVSEPKVRSVRFGQIAVMTLV
jgi:hypothetical protein